MSQSMQDLLDQYDVKKINSGDILSGEVIDVNDKEAVVNINYAFDGIISKEEVSNLDISPLDTLNVGDKIKVVVLSPNDGEGYVKLSLKRALEITQKEDLKKSFEENEAISVYVKEEVKGGLIAYYGSIRVFIPASLASRERIDIKTLINEEIKVKLTELDIRNNKIVASKRMIDEEEYKIEKNKIWKSIKSGEKRDGVVKKIIKVGAIVDIGGISGLIHITQLSWERVKKVEDVVNVGDKVSVVIGDVDIKNEKVSLILKDVNKEPWKVYGDEIKVSSVFEGKVTKFLNFGAFVEIFPSIEGLVHISEITEDNITKPSDALEIGQIVKVKILDFDKENKKISLTIKDAEEKSNEYLKYNDSDDVTLGDLFKGLF